MDFYQYPIWSSLIRNHYWILRSVRTSHVGMARRRKQYRLIKKEKERLYHEGIEPELVRVLCRHMVNLNNKRAEQRWWAQLYETKQLSFQFVE